LQIKILSREQDTLDFSEGETWTSNCRFRAWDMQFSRRLAENNLRRKKATAVKSEGLARHSGRE
jgi:hypothetical protein